MSALKVKYHIDQHDEDGNPLEKGIYLDFGHTSIRVAGTLRELGQFAASITQIYREVDSFKLLE